eukprot:TRINITY_DN11352_c0_g1_i2.p1 TRINITY_DN11352_c0_g1~~TRINITY_DN11352_c0_g1_i2.p1  ORF type:complete len:179 (-),score=14.14 TRINITY_DN11352_c0_g1_i2:51-587(-)
MSSGSLPICRRAAGKVGRKGRVMGIDLQEVTFPLPSNCKTMVQDANNFRTQNVPPLDVIMSDMAPHTWGDPVVDQYRSAELVELALSIADGKLRLGGVFVAKLFQGAATNGIMDMLKIRFEQQRIIHCEASRKQSNEIYVIGLGKLKIDVQKPSTYFAKKPEPKRPEKKPISTNFAGW